MYCLAMDFLPELCTFRCLFVASYVERVKRVLPGCRLIYAEFPPSTVVRIVVAADARCDSTLIVIG